MLQGDHWLDVQHDSSEVGHTPVVTDVGIGEAESNTTTEQTRCQEPSGRTGCSKRACAGAVHFM